MQYGRIMKLESLESKNISTPNDDSIYNLYFEQPKFLFDQFGTRELVVYNPKDTHLMLSHTSWHMLLEPHQLRLTQGWYASYDTGIPHWKYFWFD
jgi:hypothetical protein